MATEELAAGASGLVSPNPWLTGIRRQPRHRVTAVMEEPILKTEEFVDGADHILRSTMFHRLA
jgi:hypothetical protein